MGRFTSGRWLRFSLRTFLVVFTVLTTWLGVRVYHARQQAIAIAAIEAIDGYYYYDFQFSPPTDYFPDASAPGPSWVWRYIDVNLFFNVAAVGLNSKPATDETVRLVSYLQGLQQLDLASAPGVTDKSLYYIESLGELTYLRLDGTSIDPAKIDAFQQTHPTLTIER